MIERLVFTFLCFLFCAFPAMTQEDGSTRFGYRSFSISPMGIYAGNNSGFALSADVSFDYRKNIFSLGFGGGSEGDFIGKNDSFTEVNFLYGRSFPLNEKLFTEVFVGAGYFRFNTYGVIDSETNRKGDIDNKTIGFPIGAKLQFKLGPRYSMGIKLAANINSAESLGTLGLVLQWNRKRE
ncbi:MAG TPA: hypothetical protein VKX40_08350 [Aequorivita sp.]|nr:hypothetical protein [Aequorivita sp.]